MRQRKRPGPHSSPRPPFENRWGAGEEGWRWYCELERLGADYVRVRLAQQEAAGAVIEPLTPPLGFVRDWLLYLERHKRRIQLRWRLSLLAAGLVAATASVIAAIPAVRGWL